MKKNRSTIILILIFLVGLSVMLYPTVSDYVNQRHQSRALASYDETVNEMSDADYTAYFEAADAYNQRLAATPNSFFTPEQVSGYDETLDVSGTGIMGYITIPRIGVELPVYHGTSDGVLQVAAGHLEGSSLPVGGAGTHAVISAHRGLPSAKLFTNLDELETGDTFTITVLDRVLTYEVDRILHCPPHRDGFITARRGAGLRYPDDLHALRHQYPPPAGARPPCQHAGEPETCPCHGGRNTDRPHHHGACHCPAHAGSAADLAAGDHTEASESRQT